jgi:hypothetical protein
MMLHVVIRQTGSNLCYECNGGGEYDVDLVVADSGMEAMQLAAARYVRHPWEPDHTYRAFPIRQTGHKNARVLKPSEWPTHSPEYAPAEQVWG